MNALRVCGTCTEEYLHGEDHRCPATTGDYPAVLGSFVDASRRIAYLERQVVELKAENARLRADVDEAAGS